MLILNFKQKITLVNLKKMAFVFNHATVSVADVAVRYHYHYRVLHNCTDGIPPDGGTILKLICVKVQKIAENIDVYMVS